MLRRPLRRFGDGAELNDGPQNARQPGQWVSDDLRWTIINMSVRMLCGLSRERILLSTYTGVNTRTINRIKNHRAATGHLLINNRVIIYQHYVSDYKVEFGVLDTVAGEGESTLIRKCQTIVGAA